MVYRVIGKSKLCGKALPQKKEGRVGREGEGDRGERGGRENGKMRD